MARKSELLAANRSLDEIRDFIGADSLGYLSLEGLDSAVNHRDTPERGFCNACFSGDYPIPVQLEMDKLALEEP